ncbi:MAG: polysaccharide biosynthesis/export family protein [Parvibaculaceae bacterium]
MRSKASVVVPAMLCVALAGCNALPSEGPRSKQIEQAYLEKNTAGFVLVNVNRGVADYLARHQTLSFGDRFGKGKPSRAELIGPGDVLTVTIWEADQTGVFASTSTADRGTIPDVEVSSRGTISVPYAGTIKAAGRTSQGLAASIAKALSNKAVEPQVHVARKEKVASVVTVSGGVGKAGLYPLSLRGDTLLDVIAGSGGSSYPAYETVVNITRQGEIASSYLDHVQETPTDNIYMRPGDLISIEKTPRTYTAFGAVERKGNIPFGASNLNLLEAVGKSSGLADIRADASGVFLFRFEKRAAAERFATEPVRGQGERVPVIYRLNLRDPNQYFFAQAIAMQDRDVIYVADASTVALQKFLGILGSAISPPASAIRTVNSANQL